MNTADQDTSPAATRRSHSELFGRATLELTFAMLRRPYPALALTVQNAMTLAYPRDDYHTGLSAAELPLSSPDIDRIALALSALSQRLARTPGGSKTQAQLILLRSLLLDWLMLARNRNGRPARRDAS